MTHKAQLFHDYSLETVAVADGAILENHLLDGYQPINIQVEDAQLGASTNSTTYTNVSNVTKVYSPIRTTSRVYCIVQYKLTVSLINATNTVGFTQTRINGQPYVDGTTTSNSWRNTGALTYTTGYAQIPYDNTTGNNITATVDAAVNIASATVTVQDIQIVWIECAV